MGFAIPIPFLFLFWLGWAINNEYFRDTYDEAAYLREGLLYCVPLIFAGGLVAFFKFKSRKAGRVALVTAAVILLAIFIFLWSRP